MGSKECDECGMSLFDDGEAIGCRIEMACELSDDQDPCHCRHEEAAE